MNRDIKKKAKIISWLKNEQEILMLLLMFLGVDLIAFTYCSIWSAPVCILILQLIFLKCYKRYLETDNSEDK